MLHNNPSVQVVIYIAALLNGCGGEDEITEAENFDGYWSYFSQTTANSCGDGLSSSSGAVTITQIADSVMLFPNEDSEGISGRVVDDVLTWQAVVYVDGGTSTRQGELTLDADRSSARGTITFTWNDGNYACAGSQAIEISCQDGLCVQEQKAEAKIN